MTPDVMLYVFIYTVVYCLSSPLLNFLFHFPINILDPLPCIYSSSMGSYITIDSYHASVSTKYNTKMQVPRLLTTWEFCPTGTSPSTLSLCQVFSHLSLMREEVCSILGIVEALAPWPGQRRSVLGIYFRRFCTFCDSPEYGLVCYGLSQLSCFCKWNRIKSFPRWHYLWRTWCENVSLWRTRST